MNYDKFEMDKPKTRTITIQKQEIGKINRWIEYTLEPANE